jgi:hypothetical protein
MWSMSVDGLMRATSQDSRSSCHVCLDCPQGLLNLFGMSYESWIRMSMPELFSVEALTLLLFLLFSMDASSYSFGSAWIT